MIGDIIPSFIHSFLSFFLPLFPRDIKDEKRNEGKKEKHVKNVKRLVGQVAIPGRQLPRYILQFSCIRRQNVVSLQSMPRKFSCYLPFNR